MVTFEDVLDEYLAIGPDDLLEEEEDVEKLIQLVGSSNRDAKLRRKALELLYEFCSGDGRTMLLRMDVVSTLLWFISGQDETVVATMVELRHALGIVRWLSLLEEGRNELVDHGAVPSLVRYMCSADEVVKVAALRSIFNLSVVDVVVRQQIVRAGALPILLAEATVQGEGQCAAVGTLANLATESDIKRALVQVHEGLTPLLHLLRTETDNSSILTHACRALFAIAANDENKLAIADAGGLPLLLDCMTSMNDSVRMNATGALANLAIHPLNKLKLVKRGALPHLRSLAYTSNFKIQRQVARCFFALAAHVENRKSIMEENCLPALMHLLSVPNVDVQLNAAGAVGNLAMTDDYKWAVVQCGALQMLLTLAGVRDQRVQRQAVRAIFTLTSRETAKRKIGEWDNGLSVLIELTRSDNHDIQRDAAGALANMAIGTKHKDRIVALDGLSPLISLLGSRCIGVQRQAARAIFALAGTYDNQLAIIELGGLIYMNGLMRSPNDEVLKNVFGALANIANRFSKMIIQENRNVLPILIDNVHHHPNVEVRRQAARAVFNLSPFKYSQYVLNPYVGGKGEQQRVRHDMRALFENIMGRQDILLLKHKYKFPESTSSSSSSSSVESPMAPTAAKLRSKRAKSAMPAFAQTSTVPLVARHGRKRSCDDLLANFYPFGTRACQKEKADGFEHDVHLILPLPSSNSNGNQLMVENKTSTNNSTMTFEFFGHAAILSARCPFIATMIQSELVRSDGARKNNVGDLVVEWPRQYAQPKRVWLALFEFLYTDSLRLHSSYLKEDLGLTMGLSDLANSLGLYRLCCFCTELQPSVETYRGTMSSIDSNEMRQSTWAKDMAALLQPNGFLPDFSDVDLKLDSEFGSYHYGSESPKASSYTPRSKRMKTEPAETDGQEEKKEEEEQKDPELLPAPAHKVILVSRCSYFRAKFSGMEWRDATSKSVRFCGSDKALQIILRYIYCGVDDFIIKTMKEDPSLTLQVLVIANEYNLDGLQLECERSLAPQIDIDNVQVLLEELELVQAPILRTLCIYQFVSRTKPQALRDQLATFQSQDLARDILTSAEKWGFL